MDAGKVDPLTRLAIIHGTDKWGRHFYTPHYHALLSPFRERPVRLLEIGVGGYGYSSQGGRSLAMWADYFPRGHIIGIDIEPKALSLDRRITILRGSQDHTGFLARLGLEHGPFDIVIDDGSHVAQHSIVSFNGLFPRVRDGGLYIIEDTQTAFRPDFGGEKAAGGKLYEWAAEVLRGLNHAERGLPAPATGHAQRIRSFHAWHNLFVIEKGDNDEPSNLDPAAGNVTYFRDAVAVMEAVLAERPTPAGFAELAETLRVTDSPAKAMPVLDAALRRWPKDAMLLLIASRTASALGKLEDAFGFTQRALAAAPDDKQIAADLASLGRQTGRVP